MRRLKLHWLTWLAMLAVAAAGVWLQVAPARIRFSEPYSVTFDFDTGRLITAILGWPFAYGSILGESDVAWYGAAHWPLGANAALLVVLILATASATLRLRTLGRYGIQWTLTDLLRWTAVAAFVLWISQCLVDGDTQYPARITGLVAGDWAILNSGPLAGEIPWPTMEFAPLYIRVPIIFAIACLIDTLLLAVVWLVRQVATLWPRAGRPPNESSA